MTFTPEQLRTIRVNTKDEQKRQMCDELHYMYEIAKRLPSYPGVGVKCPESETRRVSEPQTFNAAVEELREAVRNLVWELKREKAKFVWFYLGVNTGAIVLYLFDLFIGNPFK